MLWLINFNELFLQCNEFLSWAVARVVQPIDVVHIDHSLLIPFDRSDFGADGGLNEILSEHAVVWWAEYHADESGVFEEGPRRKGSRRS